jgi:tetratricopeptide (TPR) repeat protein
MRIWFLLLFGPALLAAVDWTAKLEEAGRWEAEGRWQEAAAIYQQALDEGAADPLDMELALGQLAYYQSDYRGARRWYRRAEDRLRNVPQSQRWPELLVGRAVLDVVEGKLTAAELRLRQALDFSQLNGIRPLPGIYHNLASIELQTGRLSEAERHQGDALRMFQEHLGPRHEEVRRAWISYSTIAALRGDWPEAERRIRAAMEIAESPEALETYIVILEKQKRKKEARMVRERLGSTTVPVPAAHGIVDAQRLRRGAASAVVMVK